MSNSNNNKSGKQEKRDFKAEIVNHLKENPFGLTIKDIAEGIDTTRITVSKYISILELQEKVISRQIGVYKLYFSSERVLIPLNLVRSFYKGILTGLKGKLSNKKEFKELGYAIADVMKVELLEQFPKSLREKIRSFKEFLEFFGKLYPYLDFVPDKNLIIEENISKDGSKALFYLKNLNLLTLSEDFKYHFYILTGMMEKSLSRIFKREIICEVQSIDLNDKSVKISVESRKK